MIAVVLVVIGVLVFTPQSDRFCEKHKEGCSLATGFLSTGIVVLAGYFVLFVWTIRRALGKYEDLAQTAPEQLMSVAPGVGPDTIIPRTRLAKTVADEAVFSRLGAPVLVVGEAGSGKTTFLLTLIKHLALEHSIPVVVSLRDAPVPVSFRKLAQEELLRRIDPMVRSDAEAMRIWRRVCVDGRIVVLADGLDDVGPEMSRRDRDRVVRAALASARSDRIAVVATARPETVPFLAPAARVELPPLDEEQTVNYLTRRVGLREKRDENLLRTIVKTGQIAESPLYLNLIVALYRTGADLPVAGIGRDALLVELLDGWIEQLARAALLPQLEFEPLQRRRIISGLKELAFQMTLASTTEARMSQLTETLGAASDKTDVSFVIEGGSRLELIDAVVLKDDISIRFNYTITQSYLTAQHLRGSQDSLSRLVKAGDPAVIDAILTWSTEVEPDDRRDMAERLLERAFSLDSDPALAFVLGALTLAKRSGSVRSARNAAKAFAAAWPKATPRARLAAIGELSRRAEGWSYRSLYEATGDLNYQVRWAAAKAIVAGGAPAFAELESAFAETIDYACAVAWREWRRTHEISVLAWMAPGLAATTDEHTAERAAKLVQRLIELVPDKMPLGTEASLAQGCKLAVTARDFAPPESWVSLLRSCRFWYSRVVLLQALCVAAIQQRDAARRKQTETAMRDQLKRDKHPYVCETARLCLRALDREDWAPYVWEDESLLIRQSASGLADEAVTLLADLVLFLNLTEQTRLGMTKEEIDRRKEEIFGRPDLPFCLSGSHDRRQQLFGRCKCDFDLCPYPRRAEHAVARGEFSQAFCMHQIELLAPRRPIRLTIRRAGRSSWSRTNRSAQRDFWLQMTNRAL